MADGQGSVGAVPCHPDRPLSVLAIHGSADTEVPIAGGDRFAPFTDVISRWRQLDGCQPAGSVVVTGRVTRSDWGCAQGSEVKSVVIEGGGHTWPGTPLSSLPWGPSASVDASREVAEFFAAHRRASAAS
jgi:polyhydroxybutyrate depolymerase